MGYAEVSRGRRASLACDQLLPALGQRDNASCTVREHSEGNAVA
jgi:hypothetical protein